ncbi:hypothetical protein [Natronorubrum daqingense]|uniref:Uncharacterized protein n=1 Tax=Natronorubrum daqingense TaxID=588898 RepID=A0A1N7G5L7_9EURY|nr:hypothetical protein [Natronorubrum daqingense]SIS07907.1 hypothetical protein SAMN05421809_3750 [Natronorubrum daqingense]
MGKFRTNVGIALLSLAGAIGLLELSGFTDELGVSTFDALASVPLEIAAPILIVITVLAIWDPDVA